MRHSVCHSFILPFYWVFENRGFVNHLNFFAVAKKVRWLFSNKNKIKIKSAKRALKKLEAKQ